MANHEDYLDALTAFARNTPKDIPPILEQYLNGVAKNGETLFKWPLLKPLLVSKMEQVFEDLQHGLATENVPSRPNVENVSFDVMKSRVMDAVHKFTGAPFTVQRLCELLTEPKRHYKRSDKFMRGLEKNVLVVSTVDPFGRKVVSESGNKHLVNGVDNGSLFFPRGDTSMSNNLPPVPGWVASSVSASDNGSPHKLDSQDSSLSSNGVGSSLVSPMFEDQGDQPPAVHAEEVVETALSIEPSDVGPEATGAGEAMAEEDEELGTEDTNASTSSSSSSSSSEDLSSSDPDPSENSNMTSTPPPTAEVVTSSSSDLITDSTSLVSVAIGENNTDPPVEQDMEIEIDNTVPDTSDDQHTDDVEHIPSKLIKTPHTDCEATMETTAAASSSSPHEENVCVGSDISEEVVNSEPVNDKESPETLLCSNVETTVRSYAEIVSGKSQGSEVFETNNESNVNFNDSSVSASATSSEAIAAVTVTDLSSNKLETTLPVPLPSDDIEDLGEPSPKHRRLSSPEEDSNPQQSQSPTKLPSDEHSQDSEPSSSSCEQSSIITHDNQTHLDHSEIISDVESTSEAAPLVTASNDKSHSKGEESSSSSIVKASESHNSSSVELGAGDGLALSSSVSDPEYSEPNKDNSDQVTETCGDMPDSEEKVPQAVSPSNEAMCTESMEQD